MAGMRAVGRFLGMAANVTVLCCREDNMQSVVRPDAAVLSQR
jgi:hypothetical protein